MVELEHFVADMAGMKPGCRGYVGLVDVGELAAVLDEPRLVDAFPSQRRRQQQPD